jgi:hypothetical protein
MAVYGRRPLKVELRQRTKNIGDVEDFRANAWVVVTAHSGRAHSITEALWGIPEYREGYEGDVLADGKTFDQAMEIARLYNDGFTQGGVTMRPTGEKLSDWRARGAWGRAEVEREQITRVAKKGDTPESLCRKVGVSDVRLGALIRGDAEWWRAVCAVIVRDSFGDILAASPITPQEVAV